jgi:hypothetical protein
VNVLGERARQGDPGRVGVAGEGGQGLPQAARRGNLEGPVRCLGDNGLGSPSGLLGRDPASGDGGTRCAVVSRSPRVVEVKQAELGCLVMSVPGPEVGSEHGAIRRSQRCPIT